MHQHLFKISNQVNHTLIETAMKTKCRWTVGKRPGESQAEKKEDRDYLGERQNERDRIYQNGRTTQPVELEERL